MAPSFRLTVLFHSQRQFSAFSLQYLPRKKMLNVITFPRNLSLSIGLRIQLVKATCFREFFWPCAGQTFCYCLAFEKHRRHQSNSWKKSLFRLCAVIREWANFWKLIFNSPTRYIDKYHQQNIQKGNGTDQNKAVILLWVMENKGFLGFWLRSKAHIGDFSVRISQVPLRFC